MLIQSPGLVFLLATWRDIINLLSNDFHRDNIFFFLIFINKYRSVLGNIGVFPSFDEAEMVRTQKRTIRTTSKNGVVDAGVLLSFQRGRSLKATHMGLLLIWWRIM
jgi:hypothetical protein